MGRRQQNILFLCTGNSARSVIGEAILQKRGGRFFRAFSAGHDPKGRVHPMVAEVLAEKGYDVSQFKSEGVDGYLSEDAPEMDFVISVCANAVKRECQAWPGHPDLARWVLADPVREGLSDSEMRRSIEEVYEIMDQRLSTFVNLPEASQTQDALKQLDQAAPDLFLCGT